MHELSLAQSICEIAVETFRSHPGARKILRIKTRVGEMSGVEIEALRFGFEVIRESWEETRAAELEIEPVPARVRCNECGNEYEFTAEGNGCDRCGALGRDWISGRELDIFGIELQEAEE